jgi:hypothetical protein
MVMNAGLGLVFFWLGTSIEFQPSAGFLQSVAQVGATLLIAYSVETAWAVKSASALSASPRWMGFVMGIGAAGLLGIAFALGLSERVAAGHWIWIDELLFGWVAGSLTILGCLVVSLPDLTASWAQEIRRGPVDDD